MKILQIVHSFPPYSMAGTEIYTYSLCKELSKRHNIYIFHRVSDLKRKEYELNCQRSDGLEIFTINNTFRFCDSFEQFYRNADITAQFIKILDKIKPDIVHIQHLIFLSTTIINEIKKRKIPIVFTLHDYWLICPQWHFLRKDLTICNNSTLLQCVDCLSQQLNIRKVPKKIYLFFRKIMPDFFIYFLKNMYFYLVKKTKATKKDIEKIKARIRHIKDICLITDLFVAPSRFIKTKFIEFGIPENRIKILSHGIDESLFTDFRRKISDRIRFGFIGTILPAKGIDVLINAFNRIQDDRIELKIYGHLFPYKGFEYYPRYIKKIAKGKNIKFMGGFDHNDVAKIFSEIDGLVVPSIWNENLPLVILEAFLTKTPVIVSRVGNMPELIKENGLFFESRDINDLYNKMKIFIDNANLIQNFKFDIDTVKTIKRHGQEIEILYKELLNNKCLLENILIK